MAEVGFLDNDEFQHESGAESFDNIWYQKQLENQNTLSIAKNIDDLLENDDCDVSAEAKKWYKNNIDGDTTRASIRRKYDGLASRTKQYLNFADKKHAKLMSYDTDLSLNKKYEMPLDKDGLKNLKGRIEKSKNFMGLFDKVHAQFKKYGLWLFFICLLAPAAIPALLGLAFIIGGELVTHEVACQRSYNKAIRPLRNKGKNPYANMHYSKGYKEVDKLFATPVSDEDLYKALMEAQKNSKDPEAAANVNKVMADVAKRINTDKLKGKVSAGTEPDKPNGPGPDDPNNPRTDEPNQDNSNDKGPDEPKPSGPNNSGTNNPSAIEPNPEEVKPATPNPEGGKDGTTDSNIESAEGESFEKFDADKPDEPSKVEDNNATNVPEPVSQEPSKIDDNNPKDEIDKMKAELEPKNDGLGPEHKHEPEPEPQQ